MQDVELLDSRAPNPKRIAWILELQTVSLNVVCEFFQELFEIIPMNG